MRHPGRSGVYPTHIQYTPNPPTGGGGGEAKKGGKADRQTEKLTEGKIEIS